MALKKSSIRSPRFLYSLLLSLGGLQVANACGVLVHNEVFRRAQYIFGQPVEHKDDVSDLRSQIAKIISDPSRARIVQAGAFFPDWGYGCFSNDAPAEDAHWPPFLVAGIEFITKKYGPLKTSIGNDKVKDLVAFLYAVSSHASADATWHSLGMTNGLMTAISKIDFGGDWGKAHIHLDVAGDVILSQRMTGLPDKSKAWVEPLWKVPVDDIVEIYKSIGRNVSKAGLGFCAYRGLAALQALVNFSPAMYIPYATASPSTLDQLDGYYLGGLEEMSAGAANCWGQLTRYFAEGGDTSGKNGWGMCDIFKMHNSAKGAKVSRAIAHRHGSLSELLKNPEMFKHYNEYLGRIQRKADKNGSETYIVTGAKQTPKGSTPNIKTTAQLVSTAEKKFKEPVFISTQIPFSRFGQTLVVGNFSTSDPTFPSVAVSAPTESEFGDQPHGGAIYVIDLPMQQQAASQSEKALKSRPLMKVTTDSAAPTSRMQNDRFGYVSGVWNTQGKDLLVVTAPGPANFGNSVSAGRLELFRGPDRLITVEMKGAGISGTGRRQFGTAFLSADFNGDGENEVVVSASRSDRTRECGVQSDEGEVMVFNLPSLATTKGGPVVSLDDLEPIVLSIPDKICGQGTYEWFGETLAFLPRSRLLAVGAPGKSSVYFFRFNKVNSKFDNIFTLRGPERTGFGGFGMKTGVTADGTEWIAIASPNEDVGLMGEQAGKVRIYTITNEGTWATRKVELSASKTEMFGKFGMTMATDPSEGGLWIGSPWAENEKGVVWWADINAILGNGKLLQSVDIALTGSEAKAHFGASLAVTDMNKDGKADLIVGIPYSGVSAADQNQRFKGGVALYERL